MERHVKPLIIDKYVYIEISIHLFYFPVTLFQKCMDFKLEKIVNYIVLYYQQCMNIKQNVPFNHSTHSSPSLYNPC